MKTRAVEKAMQALECIRQSPQPLSLMEISSVLELTKASALRLLYTLESLHYLCKTTDGRYFAPPLSQHRELIHHAKGPLEHLRREYGETASLAGLFENHIEVLIVFESPHLMRMGNTPGRILPPNASSLGKAISAFQPAEITEKLVRSYGTHYFTPSTITDEMALRQEFAKVRAQGFAEDLEESIPGGRCFAAPILLANGNAIGAVSLSMPLLRFKEDQRETISIAVLDTAAVISKSIH